tara:strand:- start:369 stop:773 length:405 start_codon:yes stop_codon:yes gene_type:complete
MKRLFCSAIVILLVFNFCISKAHALENKSNLNKSQILILNKYAERYCSAKADHFFEGLDNEKTLKYSYFKYIGLQSDEMFSKNIYENVINQIKNKCPISDEEESEINQYFLEKLEKKIELSDNTFISPKTSNEN